MNIKKTLSALMVGAMVLSAAPVLPASASFVSTAYAAKGGAKMSIPKSAPAPKAPAAGATSNGSTSKSVSGNGSSYAPSKDAKSLEKNAPAANAKSNAAAANANTQSSSRLGSIMRGIGIFAGGMLLGSMLSHLFGMGSGMFADILGLLMNGLLIVVAIMAVRWLWTSASSSRDYRQDLEMRQQPMDGQQMRTPIQDIKPRGNDYEPKSTADRYRNR